MDLHEVLWKREIIEDVWSVTLSTIQGFGLGGSKVL